MKEMLMSRPVEAKPDRPLLENIEKLVGDTSVGEHEITHVKAIWGRGKSIQWVSTIPAADYLGVTIPAGHMSAADIQIAAMASSHHEGNGHDKAMARALSYQPDGISVESAESAAESYSYNDDVSRAAAVFLTYFGSADDGKMRMYFRWAEEDIRRRKEDYNNLPFLSDEYDAIQDTSETESEEKLTTKIEYLPDGIAHFIHSDGTEEYLCHICNTINGHTLECPIAEKQRATGEGTTVFSARSVMTPEQEAFWRREIDSPSNSDQQLRT